MEMLNSFSTLLALNDDLWKILINLFTNWISNYGWAIIVFTICLKIVMIPLDILQRKTSSVNSRAMTAMQPEMEKLQKKYGNDREKLNQEQAKLYKKYNVNMGGMCLNMFLTMGLTMLILFTLFASLRSYGTEKLYTNYQELDKVYVAAEAEAVEQGLTGEDKQAHVYTVVENAYSEQKKENSWLWVKNVWKSDTNTSQLAEFEGYAKFAGLEGEDRDIAKARHDEISTIVNETNPGQNGYYVLLILAVGVSFLTQFVSAKIMTPKGQKINMMNKIMFAIVPITMVSLAMSSNTIFTLYVIINSVMSAIISTTIALIMKRKNKDKSDSDIILSNKNIKVVEYSRNYKK